MLAEMLAQGISLAQRIVPVLAAAAVALTTLELIRRRKLREEYAMLWISASAVLLVFAVFPRLMLWISETLGVHYITIVVGAMFCFLSVVIIHLAVAISRSADDARRMAQRLALLEHKLETLAGSPGAGEQGQGATGQDR